MGTTADKLNYLIETKTALKDAIVAKGGVIEDGATFRSYAESVSAISGGGNDDVLNAVIDRSITEISGDVTTIGSYAFYNCLSLTTADFPVATSISGYAFANCSELTTVNFPVATFIGAIAFYNCPSLTTANFPAAITIQEEALYGCSELTTINFPAAITIGKKAFCDCLSLETADFPAATSTGSYAFHSCSKLTTINFPVATSIDSYAFHTCLSLETADFPAATSIAINAFNNCSKLTSLILRSESTVSLTSTNVFTKTPISSSKGYIYVPSALVESYKTATNWSTYASQFRALEDYTVDGTITGELDPNKI